MVMRMQFWCFNVLPFVLNIGPASFRRFIIDILPWKNAHKLRDMIDYMHNLGSEILKSKKAALEEGNEAVDQQVGRGKDLISILSETGTVQTLSIRFKFIWFTVNENMSASEEDQLKDSEIIAQVAIAYVFQARTCSCFPR